MELYLLAFACIFAVNLLPAFGPPTWSVLVFVKLQYECGPDQVKNWRPVNLRFYEVEAEVNNRMDEIWLGKKKLDKAHMVDLKKAVDGILARPVL